MTIKDIDLNIAYEGYLWLSDRDNPIVCYGNKALREYLADFDIYNSTNPFVVEGFLYNRAEKQSVAIKSFDGKTYVKDYQDQCKENANDKDIVLKSYFPNRMDKVEKLNFLEYWESEKDTFCEDMPVLRPTKFVFVGF